MGSVSHFVGGITGRNASHAARKANRYSKEQLGKIETEVSPYITAGTNAVNALGGLLAGPLGESSIVDMNSAPAGYNFDKSAAPAAYSPTAFSFNFSPNDPSYQWRLQQGMDAAKADAAASGMFGSGNMYSGLMDLGQNMASQEYGNEYNRQLNAWQALEALKAAAGGQAYDQWATTEQLGMTNQKALFDEWAVAQGLDQASREALWNRYFNTAQLGANEVNALGGFRTGVASGISNNLMNAAGIQAQASNALMSNLIGKNGIGGMITDIGAGIGAITA